MKVVLVTKEDYTKFISRKVEKYPDLANKTPKEMGVDLTWGKKSNLTWLV
jgi:hypothetical protein